MANQISKDKKKITVVLSHDQIKRLDGRAAELGTSRTALISEAVDALLDGGAAGGVPAGSFGDTRLDTIIAKLDAMDAANRLAAAGVLDAVRNQPIAAQQLPEKRGALARLFR